MSANINIDDLYLLYNWKTVILFVSVVFIVRPLAVFLSTTNSNLELKEKLFISWVGPRGIVAAGIASLFGSKLIIEGVEGSEYITPLVFMIVLGTVLLNATTARLFAKIVGVFLTKSNGILIIGAAKVSRIIAKYLAENGRHVVLIDSNQNNIQEALSLGLDAFATDIYSDTLKDNIELNDIGYLLALTGNTDINKFAINKFSKQFGENGSFRLVAKGDMFDGQNTLVEDLFSQTDDFNTLTEVTLKFPTIHELTLKDSNHYFNIIKLANNDKEIIPLFIKHSDGELQIIHLFNKEADQIASDTKLVYLGKLIN